MQSLTTAAVSGIWQTRSGLRGRMTGRQRLLTPRRSVAETPWLAAAALRAVAQAENVHMSLMSCHRI